MADAPDNQARQEYLRFLERDDRDREEGLLLLSAAFAEDDERQDSMGPIERDIDVSQQMVLELEAIARRLGIGSATIDALTLASESVSST